MTVSTPGRLHADGSADDTGTCAISLLPINCFSTSDPTNPVAPVRTTFIAFLELASSSSLGGSRASEQSHVVGFGPHEREPKQSTRRKSDQGWFSRRPRRTLRAQEPPQNNGRKNAHKRCWERSQLIETVQERTRSPFRS